MKKLLSGGLLFFLAAFAAGNAFAQESLQTKAPGRVTRELKILKRPPASYPKIEGTVHVQGTVALRVTFGADGRIKDVSAISTLPYGLTESATEAAWQIKFRPQKVDGRPVTVTKVIQYVFYPF